jgi:hypothetical protein
MTQFFISPRLPILLDSHFQGVPVSYFSRKLRAVLILGGGIARDHTLSVTQSHFGVKAG